MTKCKRCAMIAEGKRQCSKCKKWHGPSEFAVCGPCRKVNRECMARRRKDPEKYAVELERERKRMQARAERRKALSLKAWASGSRLGVAAQKESQRAVEALPSVAATRIEDELWGHVRPAKGWR